jgi:hypothetical protein
VNALQITAHYMNGYGFRTMNGLGFDAERDIRMSMFFKPEEFVWVRMKPEGCRSMNTDILKTIKLFDLPIF